MCVLLVTHSTRVSRKLLIVAVVLTSSISASVLVSLHNPSVKILIRKAWLFYNRAFFVWVAIFLYCGSLQAASYCQLDKASLSQLESVEVATVSDGDSLVLMDRRRVRLMSINTPETYLNQPLSEIAKQALVSLLSEQPRVFMRVGKESQDKYGRWLADLYLSDGRNVAAEMLVWGWGFLVVIPPNVSELTCMTAARDFAREQSLGVWGQPFYHVKSSLHTQSSGFIRIKGKLMAVEFTAKGWWLRLEGNVVLRIKRSHQAYFDRQVFKKWLGKTVVASGWMIDRGKQRKQGRSRFMLILTHPVHLQKL